MYMPPCVMHDGTGAVLRDARNDGGREGAYCGQPRSFHVAGGQGTQILASVGGVQTDRGGRARKHGKGSVTAVGIHIKGDPFGRNPQLEGML